MTDDVTIGDGALNNTIIRFNAVFAWTRTVVAVVGRTVVAVTLTRVAIRVITAIARFIVTVVISIMVMITVMVMVPMPMPVSVSMPVTMSVTMSVSMPMSMSVSMSVTMSVTSLMTTFIVIITARTGTPIVIPAAVLVNASFDKLTDPGHTCVLISSLVDALFKHCPPTLVTRVYAAVIIIRTGIAPVVMIPVIIRALVVATVTPMFTNTLIPISVRIR